MQEVFWSLAVVIIGAITAAQVPAIGRPWLAYWHGRGAVNQYEFFRCQGCRRLVTHHLISTGGCPCRESFKVAPAVLRWSDKLRLVYLPWTVTSWPRRQQAVRLTAAASVRMAQREARPVRVVE